MSHTIDDKTNLLAQTQKLREKADTLNVILGKEASCEDVMTVVAEAHQIIQAIADEVGDDHDKAHKQAA